MNSAVRPAAAGILSLKEAGKSAPPHWGDFLALPENRSALEAVRAVAKATRAGRRPPVTLLLLHGSPGTGKSHLISVLLRHLARGPAVITAQAVAAADVARSSASEETLGFADPDLDSCDLLVVEDVQLLPAREADAFCSLLDRRQSRRRATVVTSSAGPAGLRHLPRKLTSRLAAGLVLQLEPISRGSRRILLDYAANARGLRISPDALDWLADQAESGSARVLLGLIANIAPAARGTAVLDRTAVEQVLSGSGQPTAARRDVARIVKQVASAFGVWRILGAYFRSTVECG